jgi:molybdenum-dependent DNA-binding transcriptional regulator ModE
MLTKREKGFLHAASRKCGMSYRSACNRDIDIANRMRKEGYLHLSDNGKDKGRFVFWITDKGKQLLQETP